MWCPSATLAVWANAWLAGSAAPDDVLDALSLWAPKHSVTAYDAAAARLTGLPWPDLNHAGAVSLLQTLRTAVGRPAAGPAMSVVLPVPGDVRGLPAGTQFQRDALATGEALVISGAAGSVGLVPDFEYDNAEYGDASAEPDLEPELSALAWTVYSVQDVPAAGYLDLGEAEYELRSAVRAAADALVALRAGGAGADVSDPRGLVEQVLEAGRAHRLPDPVPERAQRVLENAARIDAIITVSSGLMPIGLQSSSEVEIASGALRPLSGLVRSARVAATSAIIQSAWR